MPAMRAPRHIAYCIALSFAVLLCSGHVGSPDVWYAGNAGPYGVRVLIRPPVVVPGLADIVVDVEGATRVTVTAASSSTGPEGAPPPDVMTRTDGTQSFHGRLWLMAPGAYRVIVTVSGAKGDGVAYIPVSASATIRRPMPAYLGILLAAGGLFLLFGMISIVGSAVRESLLPPGTPADHAQRQRARRGMVTALVVISALIVIGCRWWINVDRRHKAILDHPWTSIAALDDSAHVLRFEITDSTWLMRHDTTFTRKIRFAEMARRLIEDHGKIMHLFVIRDGDMGVFAHLHPTSTDEDHFVTDAPQLPPGLYHVFGDIVQASGDSRTIATTLRVPANAHADSVNVYKASDADDAVWTGGAAGTLTQRDQQLDTGVVMRWVGPASARAEEPVELRADMVDARGNPVKLEPYMGMAAHAVVAAPDGSVFVHLHPMGTISAAAQSAVAGAGTTPAMGAMGLVSHLSFPYAFPKPGHYRVWVQIRHGDRILTGAHDVEVTAR